MKKLLQNYAILNLIGVAILLNGCMKSTVEPSLDGTWIEIDNTSSQTPTGCTLTIDKSSEKINMCGFEYIQPKNVVTVTTRRNARLYVENGQMFYRQKDADVLWIAAISREDHYFMDYALDGEFLWVVGENTSTKTNPVNQGKVFIKQ
jgi:hypothetical protein